MLHGPARECWAYTAGQGGCSPDGCTTGEALAVPAAPLDRARGLLGTDMLTRLSAQPLVPGGLGRGGHRQQQHRHCDKPEGLAAGCSPLPSELLLLFIMLCDCPARAQGCLGQTQATALGGGLSSLSLPVSLLSAGDLYQQWWWWKGDGDSSFLWTIRIHKENGHRSYF